MPKQLWDQSWQGARKVPKILGPLLISAIYC